MTRTAVLLFIAGLVVMTVLVASHGAGDIWHALSAIGWLGFALVCVIHIAILGLGGVSWWAIAPGVPGNGPGTYMWARLVRDSGAEILPLSQLGGFVMGARAAALAGVPTAVAVASLIVDVTLELFAQLAFTAIGLATLISIKPDAPFAMPVAGGLVVMLAAAIGFVIAQRRGFSLAGRIGAGLLGDWVRTGLALPAIEASIAQIYGRGWRIGMGGALHLACWVAGAAEAWLALWLMGVSVSFGAMLAIESLLYAARSVAFAVPNAVGVQEGAYLALGAIFGLPADTVLALSLLKRARDFILGTPALLIWQVIEARRAVMSGTSTADKQRD